MIGRFSPLPHCAEDVRRMSACRESAPTNPLAPARTRTRDSQFLPDRESSCRTPPPAFRFPEDWSYQCANIPASTSPPDRNTAANAPPECAKKPSRRRPLGPAAAHIPPNYNMTCDPKHHPSRPTFVPQPVVTDLRFAPKRSSLRSPSFPRSFYIRFPKITLPLHPLAFFLRPNILQ